MTKFTEFQSARTEQEFGVLFDPAGSDLTRIVPTASPLSVVEAKPKA